VSSARNTVVTTMAAGTGVVVVANAVNGRPPTPKELIGLAVVYAALGMASDVAPNVARPFSVLVLAGILLVKGEDLGKALSNPNPSGARNARALQDTANIPGVGAAVSGATSASVGSAPGFGAVSAAASKNVQRGGIGGDWAGAGPIAETIAIVSGLPVISRKRATKNTADGGISDHYEGQTDAYAVDLGATGAVGDKAAEKIAEWLGVKGYKGGRWLSVNKGGYRIQVGWRVKDHYDHIHVGVNKL
jgi:hypothetical protein